LEKKVLGVLRFSDIYRCEDVHRLAIGFCRLRRGAGDWGLWRGGGVKFVEAL
jgi:hypothetical protein